MCWPACPSAGRSSIWRNFYASFTKILRGKGGLKSVLFLSGAERMDRLQFGCVDDPIQLNVDKGQDVRCSIADRSSLAEV